MGPVWNAGCSPGPPSSQECHRKVGLEQEGHICHGQDNHHGSWWPGLDVHMLSGKAAMLSKSRAWVPSVAARKDVEILENGKAQPAVLSKSTAGGVGRKRGLIA